MKNKEPKVEDKRNYGIAGILFDAVSIFITAIALLAVVFTFGFRMVGVDGRSMNNTLFTGDWLLVTPYYSEAQYGDIVIAVQKTSAHGPLVKRVIARGGDEVMFHPDDTVEVNGVVLDETYALTSGTYANCSQPKYLKIPEGYLLLMGDNRANSMDSRDAVNVGLIREDYLLGKARVRLDKDNWDIYYNFTHDATKD